MEKARSLGGAMALGVPIVFTAKGRKPEVVCEPGKEAQALETMEKMGLITLLRPHKGDEPDNVLAVYGEQKA